MSRSWYERAAPIARCRASIASPDRIVATAREAKDAGAAVILFDPEHKDGEGPAAWIRTARL
jgi:hypothetical protein